MYILRFPGDHCVHGWWVLIDDNAALLRKDSGGLEGHEQEEKREDGEDSEAAHGVDAVVVCIDDGDKV
jgi:hypothetical protein